MKLAWTTLTVPKAGHTAAENEDALAVSKETGRVAVCDGASEGWGSALWARHLADALVTMPAQPQTFSAWLAKVRQSAVTIAPPVVSWYAETKQADGAFATLLSVVFSPGKYHAVAVGDTSLFHLRDDKLVARFPVEKSSDFGNQPALVGSAGGEIEPDWFAGRCESGDRFYLLSDALAEWFLRNAEGGECPWQVVDAVTSAADAQAEFADWVQSLRAKRTMKNDDTTLVRVRIL